MPFIAAKKNWGSALQNANPLLARQLDEMYTDVVGIINTSIKKYVVNGSSPVGTAQINANFDVGDHWCRTDTNEVWIMTSRINNETVTWRQIQFI